jgi:hypothetical protein
MKRKSALKKLYPNRHKVFIMLREQNFLKNVITSNGNEISLNVMKHFLFRDSYANLDFNRELLRFAKSSQTIAKEANNNIVSEEVN